MGTIFTNHIVLMHWIRKEIHLFTIFYKFLDQGLVMLHYDHVINRTMNQE